MGMAWIKFECLVIPCPMLRCRQHLWSQWKFFMNSRANVGSMSGFVFHGLISEGQLGEFLSRVLNLKDLVSDSCDFLMNDSNCRCRLYVLLYYCNIHYVIIHYNNDDWLVDIHYDYVYNPLTVSSIVSSIASFTTSSII